MSLPLASLVQDVTGSPLGVAGALLGIQSAAQPAVGAPSWPSALAPSLLQGLQATQQPTEPQPEIRRERPPNWTV